MRRAIVTIGGTAAGLAALLAFKTHPISDVAASTPSGGTPAATQGAGAGGADGMGTIASASPSSSMQSMKKGTSAHRSGKAMPSASSSGMSGMPMGTRTITGMVADTMHGPMQVQIVLTGTRITKVNILKQTDDGQTSIQVNAFAIPKLTSETLTAQSARIDAVSGATFTSQGYIQSLQSALDKA